MRPIIHILLLACLLLSGCQALAAPIENTTAPLPLTLEPCTVAGGAVKAECGILSVPEDRANPAGRTLDLDLVVVRAQKPNPEPDPLFYLAGGPGGAATASGTVVTVNHLFDEINAARDVVFLDQRGTNAMHRLACEPIPFSVAEASQGQMDDWMKECLSGLDGDPRFYTTAEAMRDLDAARAALGYDQINLYGISYGAAAAQVYMRMFPERVRAAVLDHGTALDLPFQYAMPNASQAALDQIFTYCEQDEACRAAYPAIRADWQAVLDRLAQGPVATSYVPPKADRPAELTMDGLADGLHNLMYKSGTYVQIPYLIHTLAATEDWGPVVKSYQDHYASGGSPQPLQLMALTIFCFEPAWGYDPDEVTRLNPDSYYRDLQAAWARSEQKLCASLPQPDPALIYPPGQPAPLSALMLNSLLDPQNPPANMEPALREFTRSRIVTEKTEGHDASASSCRWGIITQYIQQGSADKLDLTCLEKQEPSFVTLQ